MQFNVYKLLSKLVKSIYLFIYKLISNWLFILPIESNRLVCIQDFRNRHFCGGVVT